MKSLLYGRELLETEIPKVLFNEISTYQDTIETPSTHKVKGKICCIRCEAVMTVVSATECFCEKTCAYCRNCIKMGKVRACQSLYHLTEPNDFKRKGIVLEWAVTLSKQQEEASVAIINSINQKETRLLWAVAGAGKTEMLFPGIEIAMQQNKRVCIATPRVDVVLELAPRIQKAFPTIPISVLYGGMEEPYTYKQLVIATTHQLYRFKEAFDVMIIDEVDAFPFHLDESLKFAANKARKTKSTLIYLSATPDQAMQKQVNRGKLLSTILPARYHGHPLPVPKSKYCSKWREKLLENPLKTIIGKEMHVRIQNKKRFIVFIPNIEWMKLFEKTLQQIYPKIAFVAVHSEDTEREEKVMQMRNEKVAFILTTTILERGVTFPNVDVLVIGAEDRVFTESALVQIAGRAGRSPKYPTGDVIYFHDGQSLAMKKAVQQIKKMNHLAKKRGLIK